MTLLQALSDLNSPQALAAFSTLKKFVLPFSRWDNLRYTDQVGGSHQQAERHFSTSCRCRPRQPHSCPAPALQFSRLVEEELTLTYRKLELTFTQDPEFTLPGCCQAHEGVPGVLQLRQQNPSIHTFCPRSVAEVQLVPSPGANMQIGMESNLALICTKGTNPRQRKVAAQDAGTHAETYDQHEELSGWEGLRNQQQVDCR